MNTLDTIKVLLVTLDIESKVLKYLQLWYHLDNDCGTGVTEPTKTNGTENESQTVPSTGR